MSKSNLYKIIIPLLFIVAITAGLLRREKTEVFEFNNSNSNLQDELLNYYQTGQNSIKSSEPQKASVNFLAVGDIMLSRKVAKEMDNNNDWLLPYSKTEHWLNSVDFVFGNLESPFNGTEYYNPGETLIFNSPLKAIEGLKLNNFKVLQLANNHAFDQGKKGLEFTQNLLNEFDIHHIGTGSTTAEAFKPVIIEQNGLKICFIAASYASMNDSGKTINDYVARIEDLDLLKTNIQNLKATCDFTVASMHAGTEYTHQPNKAQITFAHAAIDYGADMVIGHHPHWVQKIEKYNNKYIFYSLGNFIFDQMWSQETKEGLALKISLSKNLTAALQGPKTMAELDSIELLPVIIENFSTPRPATAEETKTILNKIGETNTILK